jgi:hypothetical protein
MRAFLFPRINLRAYARFVFRPTGLWCEPQVHAELRRDPPHHSRCSLFAGAWMRRVTINQGGAPSTRFARPPPVCHCCEGAAVMPVCHTW